MSVQIPNFPSAEEDAALEDAAARRQAQSNTDAEVLILRAQDLAANTGTTVEAGLVALCTVETSKWWNIMQDTLRMLREAKADADVQD